MTYETIDPIKKKEYQRLSKEIADKVNTYLSIKEMDSLDFTKPCYNIVFIIEELLDNPDNYENLHGNYSAMLENMALAKYLLEKTTPDNSYYYKRQIYQNEIVFIHIGHDILEDSNKTVLDVYNEMKKEYPTKNIYVYTVGGIYVYNGESNTEMAKSIYDLVIGGKI